MNNRRIRPFFAGAALLLGLLGITVPAVADQPAILSVQTGHSVIIDANGLNRVAVGNGTIAGVVPIGTSQVIINGKAPGHTTIFIWDDKGRRTFEVTVTEQGFDDIAKLIRSAINEPNVQVVAFGQNLVVRGTVADSVAFARLSDILDRFKGAKFTSSGGQNGVILNTVSISSPLGSVQSQIAAISGASGVKVEQDAKGDIIVTGSAHDAVTERHVIDRVRGLAGPYLSSDGKVIDRLAVDTISQVDVKVYVLEVDNSVTSQLGLRLQGAALSSIPPAGGSTTFTIVPPSFIGIENPARAANFGGALTAIGSYARDTLLAPTLDLLLQEGHARLLSSPDLMTTPGNEASFLVGGQIPIPVSNGLGSVTITYQTFGVNLKVTPTLLGNGSIESKIDPEVSDLDFTDGVQLNGFVVPGIKISKLSTDIITQSGESIVMGGLLRRIENKNVSKIPVLGDLPILGALFRSVSYQRQDSDVIFVLTPTVVTR